MYEIELKARVADAAAVAARIESFAGRAVVCEKFDVYWKQDAERIIGRPVQVRIREEISDGSRRCTVTYKRKQLKPDRDGSSYEMNEEFEFAVDNRSAFEAFLADSGYGRSSDKHKSVRHWDADGIVIELCEVKPLGFFLELEALSADVSGTTAADTAGRLKQMLNKCGIGYAAVEPRFYSELLSLVD